MKISPHIQIAQAAKRLQETGGTFVELFQHGSLVVEYYKPEKQDLQTPHDRDEIYVIAAGSGTFICDEKPSRFLTGDFLFVAAGTAHRFIDFTDDFATWVFFYGPKGGECPL